MTEQKTREPRYQIETRHGELHSLFYVIDTQTEATGLESFRDREEAEEYARELNQRADDRAQYETETRYRAGAPEIHGHTSYQSALAFAQSRETVNGVGNVSVAIYRIEGERRRWLETLGWIRELQE